MNFSSTEYLESIGVRAGTRVLSMRTIPADEVAAERLRLEPGTPVVEVRRVRTADDRPAVYSVDLIPAAVVDPERDRDALGRSLYALLAAVGHPVTHGEAILAPAQADAELAAVLEVAPGTLLQFVDQVDVAADGRPVMLSHEWHVPSVIELRCFRRGPGLALGGGGEG